MVFRGVSLLCPPLPGKAIKPSFLTSPETLSPRFDSAAVHREDTLLAPELLTCFAGKVGEGGAQGWQRGDCVLPAGPGGLRQNQGERSGLTQR